MIDQKSLDTPERVHTWCPGCGNFGIFSAFKNALVQLGKEEGLEKENVVIVSGIGQHGKMVNYVNVNGFHGIHGRVLPIATGIKLANPNLTVIGFAGDADQYDEGWGHFVHATRRNIDITLIVHDNMILGLTAGQTTATSLQGFKSKSTPFGSVNPPLNPVAHALVGDGTFVARGFAGDVNHLQSLMVSAIKHRGFGYVDVFQPCVSLNYLNTFDWFRRRVYKLEDEGHDFTDKWKALEKSFEWGDRIPIGLFYKGDRPTLSDKLPQVKDQPIVRMSLEGISISSLIDSMK